jgi:hypothetical protein
VLGRVIVFRTTQISTSQTDVGLRYRYAKVR